MEAVGERIKRLARWWSGDVDGWPTAIVCILVIAAIFTIFG